MDTPREIRRVLVFVDSLVGLEPLLHRAAALADRFGATCHIMRVLGSHGLPEDLIGQIARLRQVRIELSSALTHMAPTLSTDFQVHVCAGDVGRIIGEQTSCRDLLLSSLGCAFSEDRDAMQRLSQRLSARTPPPARRIYWPAERLWN